MANHKKITYTLSKKESEIGLKLSGYYRINSVKMLVQNIFLCLMFVFFIVSFIINKQSFNILMAIVSLLVIAMLNFVPMLDIKKQAEKINKDIKITVDGEVITYFENGVTVQIFLEKSEVKYSKKHGLFVIIPKRGGFLALPLRVISEKDNNYIKDLLLKHCDK